MRKLWVITAFAVAALAVDARSSYAVSIGLTDTFSVDEQNWFAGGGPVASLPPVPPDQKPTGGPDGPGDGFLQVTATGGVGPGSRLAVMNTTQWTGDYLAAGVGSIGVDLQNQGSSDLVIRLLFDNSSLGPPVDVGITAFGAVLPAGSGWMHFVFPVTPADLVAQGGSDMTTLLANVTLLRIIHSVGADDPDVVIGQLGVDNITAFAVPEPATLLLMMSGAVALAMRRRRDTRRTPRPTAARD